MNKPIIDQPIKQIGEVIIGDGTWLVENVCIIGAKIDKNCVIGANSIVTKDIPDYSVVFGTPAKIFKDMIFIQILGKKQISIVHISIYRK